MPPAISDYYLRIVNTIIGATTLRNQGAPGVVEAARVFLRALNLQPFVQPTPALFLAELDRQTDALKDALPLEGRSFGAARKALNLVLAEAYYHQFICQTYDLEQIASFLEVPLDATVATFLYRAAREQGVKLPTWPGIKYLRRHDSDRYQAYAAEYAAGLGEGWHRVHIDVMAWGR